MNYWTQQSIEFAQQKNYLDELFKVYPLNPNLRRELLEIQINNISSAYEQRDNIQLIKTLLEAELFPLKDSYIPFLRHDREAITRNPQTVNRIAGNLYQIAILDGVLYIKGKNKMHEYIINHRKDNIFSALVLREFLYSL